ncbi:heptosyltransferase I [Azorhizobium oxalatiphilum]|uniref:Lipopolysaccharide heptosyltransferase 1 n=1 Tax=Azorhizobium oxalatiphilum TaxID=980631 RepID=A0A917BX31_9HYPH|nr:lipopolysaccharide heptosyltransferase I [Azorhizobium oxalatiphilum]GGF59923.1 heptosyltransferase I [Azorhizobium oxalatiphilum]
MKVLVIKLSSLGDVVHTFPAVTDAARAIPGLELDWAVEDAFVPLVKLHPSVRRVIPVPLRRLKKKPLAALRSGEAGAVRAALQSERYDVVIDAQGLMKSAAVGLFAHGRRHGFDRATAREGMASLTYGQGHHLPETEHMAVRIRKLFAAALGYSLDGLKADAGLVTAPPPPMSGPYWVFLHGTTWGTKTWTVPHWRELAARAGKAKLDVVLFAHGAKEEARAAAIAADLPNVHRAPPAGLDAVAPILAGAEAVVTVDTGLGHLAAALGVPTIGLYGPTNPVLTGLFGPKVLELRSLRDCAPCEKQICRIAPDRTEGPPCLADFTGSDIWRSVSLLRLGSADAMDKM